MDKNNAISKINKAGKVGQILANISKVFVIIGIVGVLIGTIVLAVLPKGFFDMTVYSQGVIELDMKKLGVKIPPTEMDEIRADIMEGETGANMTGSISINNSEFHIENTEITQDKIVLNGEMDAVSLGFENLVVPMIGVVISMGITLMLIFYIGSLCKAFRYCVSPFEENVVKKMQRLAYALIPWYIVNLIANAMAQSLTEGAVSINIEAGIILVVVIVFILLHIFKYGATLQQESDETL